MDKTLSQLRIQLAEETAEFRQLVRLDPRPGEDKPDPENKASMSELLAQLASLTLTQGKVIEKLLAERETA